MSVRHWAPESAGRSVADPIIGIPQRTVTAAELLRSGDGESPGRLRVHPARASDYAARLGLRHVGPDFELDAFRPLSALDEAGLEDRHALTYLSSGRFARALDGRAGLTVVTTPDLRACVPPELGVLIADADPRNVFYSAMNTAQDQGRFECLESFVSDSAKISPAAVISPHVHVSDRAEIGPGAVLLSNTYVGAGAVIKPNAVIGGDGFEATSGVERRIVRHAGGVWLGEGVQVGSCTCIDKGLFGDFTVVGSHSLIDNLVHFAHSACAGERCSIIAGAEISGSVVLGDGVWVGPNAAINQGIHIGEHCYIGTGSVVTRDLEPHSLAYGSPAKPMAKVCACRAKLCFENGRALCTSCGKAYILAEEGVKGI